MCRKTAQVDRRVVLAESVFQSFQIEKADDREYGFLRRCTACIRMGVASLSEMIGGVHPEAVSLAHPACIFMLSVSIFF